MESISDKTAQGKKKDVLGNGKGNREKFIHVYFIVRNNPSK